MLFFFACFGILSVSLTFLLALPTLGTGQCALVVVLDCPIRESHDASCDGPNIDFAYDFEEEEMPHATQIENSTAKMPRACDW